MPTGCCPARTTSCFHPAFFNLPPVKSTYTIRPFFAPLQPAYAIDGDITYTETWPDIRLQEMIYCFWALHRACGDDSPYACRVVADGCIDVFFNLHDPGDSSIMGFCTTFTEFPLAGPFLYAGIRFLPAMFTHLTGIPASLLSDRCEALQDVMPELAAFISRNFSAESAPDAIAEQLNVFFLHKLMQLKSEADPRFLSAMRLILQQHGGIGVNRLDTGLSERQLRRLFLYYVGDTAKTFSKVVRFQQALRLPPGGQPRFLEAGYYDQAHYIRAFRTFYGATPGQVHQR